MTAFTVMSDNNLKQMHAKIAEQEEQIKKQAYELNNYENEQTEAYDFVYAKKKVEKWAFDKGIYTNSTATAQLLKAVSEVGELADAELKGNVDEIEDAVGDVLVCLINYCKLAQLDLTECLYGAYNTIKERQGKMVNGAFVKDE